MIDVIVVEILYFNIGCIVIRRSKKEESHNKYKLSMSMLKGVILLHRLSLRI